MTMMMTALVRRVVSTSSTTTCHRSISTSPALPATFATTIHSLWPHALGCFNSSHGSSRRQQPYSSSGLSDNSQHQQRHGTTIIVVRKSGKVCLMGDGMVSQGGMIVKPNAMKLRRLGVDKEDKTDNGDDENLSDETDNTVLVGFAGTTADALTLVERLEASVQQYPGQLRRAAVEVAKGWRTDRYLRKLEAALLVADAKESLEMTGNGDVLQSHDGVLGIGSGGPYAVAAARALMDMPDLTAEEVARKAMTVAADMCVYTNHNFQVEVLDTVSDEGKDSDDKA